MKNLQRIGYAEYAKRIKTCQILDLGITFGKLESCAKIVALGMKGICMIKEYLLSAKGKREYQNLKKILSAPQYKNAGRQMMIYLKSDIFDLLLEGVDKSLKSLYKNQIPLGNHFLKRAGS